ncbi:hypothetical protein NQ315_011457 [Exocentrus adspersus]|uniref:Anoctamin n=1 Tax=Exocentrus adspersus TaxID=1586481 RepID=A0AAV8VUZ8_9CUCU|nr:hypothetical protein NQ315_011457 [Exocentrus adspersus]
MRTHSSLFFHDGRKTIDFVLVYKSDQMNETAMTKQNFYLDNLIKTGLYVEVDQFSVDKNTYFMKIHIPKEIVTRYADIFDIELTCNRSERPSHIEAPCRFMATPLTRPDSADSVYARATETLSEKQPNEATSAERIMVLYKILCRTKFGVDRSAYGIDKLLKEKVFADAFPLHEGPREWSENGPLTDRQLLCRFWGSPRCWYKAQPMNLIEKYYGTELAFYFAWLGLYIRMLMPLAAASLLCVVYGLVTLGTSENARSNEICNSDILMCPRCHFKDCKYTKLSNSCIQSHVGYLFDNPGTITFAVVTSFWATVFIELWGRRQAVLQLEWNVKSLEHDISMRPQYAHAAVKTKVSPVSGAPMPYIPNASTTNRFCKTFQLIVMILGIMGVIVYRLTIIILLHDTTKDRKITTENTRMFAVVTGSFISVCFIITFKAIYTKVALWLTNLENPRTQYQYDNSYIYKNYALAFTNNYAVVLYIAFFKGRFYTHPGDKSLWTDVGAIGSDICDPTGCSLDLSIQVTMILFIKLFMNNFLQLLIPVPAKSYIPPDMPQCEADYLKADLNQFYLIDEYMDMVIQYGFVVFFVAAFPLAPVLALINNFVELRVDSYKFTNSFRRPVPKRVANVGAWMGILQALTYVGVVTNALVIAFTSEFVPKEIYRYNVDYKLRGYINTTISAFDRSELDASLPPGSLCYYPGKRYPPDHEFKYTLTRDYWYVLAVRLMVVVIFEHIVMLTKGILAYAIPDVPAHVTERIALEEKKDKEARFAAVEKLHDAQERRNSIDAVSQKAMEKDVPHGCFFSDGKKRADYALVIQQSSDTLKNYIVSLEKLGLELEVVRKPDVEEYFILIHIPPKQVDAYSKIYDIGLEIPKRDVAPKRRILKFFQTDLNAPLKKRGYTHLDFEKKNRVYNLCAVSSEFVSKDRIMIIQKLLERAGFGKEEHEGGLNQLLKQQIVKDAYPLHDGPATSASKNVIQNDRRLLYLHWAKFSCWYKEAPLDLLQKYFGCEVAFYFAWVEFFTLMLLPPAILGVLVFVINLTNLHISDITQVNEICQEHGMKMCPACAYKRYCVYKPLSKYCFYAEGNFLFDNYLTVVYAVFMSFWGKSGTLSNFRMGLVNFSATLFLELWKRKQNYLRTKWDVQYDNEEVEIRPEYRSELRKRKIEKTGELEPLLPHYIWISRVIATTTICFFLILVVLAAVFSVTVFKIIFAAEARVGTNKFFRNHNRMFASVFGSILQMYGKLSIWLTTLENPRTKRDFDNSVLYKRYFLAFANNYSALFYIAFFKGRFYRIPFPEGAISRLLATDTCQPNNCVLLLGTQLAFLMVLKRLAGNIISIIILSEQKNFKTLTRKARREKIALADKVIPHYEADFVLLPTNQYLLTTEFCEMIIEFGFVTFFVAAFPLAPLCSLLNNILEHRLDARKLVMNYRRPPARKMSGIGAWDGVMLGVTYLSTATNAFVIAFTSDFVWREYYRGSHGSLGGFVKSTLSEYATKDFPLFHRTSTPAVVPDVCYYRDKRYAPGHTQQYELTSEYWIDISLRLASVLVFEHVILLLNGILSYAIPDLPTTVKEQMHLDRQMAKEAKIKSIGKQINASQKRQSVNHSNWLAV